MLPDIDLVACCGTIDDDNDCTTDVETVFDLASLTKPLVTALCCFTLIDQGLIDWLEPLDSLLEQSISTPLRSLDLISLLTHSSGLPAHRNYWQALIQIKETEHKSWLLKKILEEKPIFTKGKKNLYSDIGYILLGYIIETKTGKSIDQFWREKIAVPLKIDDSLFYPSSKKDSMDKTYAVTGSCRWTGRKLQGIVHDDNCRAMGGVAGHAGLFGTASSVLQLCRQIFFLHENKKSALPFTTAIIRNALRRKKASDWCAGFMMPGATGSSSGSFFSLSSVGHLGFTGTSFWIDMERGLIVVLLTNRICKGDDRGAIREMRPHIHNHIVSCLEGSKFFPRK